MSQTTPTLDERIIALAERNASIDKQLITCVDIADSKATQALEELKSLSLRNIGEIVYSTIPLVDAFIHPANGTEILKNGVYANFVEYMYTLYTDPTHEHDHLFCTQAEFDDAVDITGACGKYVFNATTGDLRLPKLTGMVAGTVDRAAIGDLLGFTTTEATAPKTPIINGYVYIVLANAVRPSAIADLANGTSSIIGDLATDINSKTNVAQAAHAAMPSGQYIDLTFPASGGTVTAPADGWLNGFGVIYGGEDGGNLGFINTTNNMQEGEFIPVANGGINVVIPVSKGDVIEVTWINLVTPELRFIYANGSVPTV